jgi:hypothetical protein
MIAGHLNTHQVSGAFSNSWGSSFPACKVSFSAAPRSTTTYNNGAKFYSDTALRLSARAGRAAPLVLLPRALVCEHHGPGCSLQLNLRAVHSATRSGRLPPSILLPAVASPKSAQPLPDLLGLSNAPTYTLHAINLTLHSTTALVRS